MSLPFTGLSHWEPHSDRDSTAITQLIDHNLQALSRWHPLPHRKHSITQEHKQILKFFGHNKNIVIKPANKRGTNCFTREE